MFVNAVATGLTEGDEMLIRGRINMQQYVIERDQMAATEVGAFLSAMTQPTRTIRTGPVSEARARWQLRRGPGTEAPPLSLETLNDRFAEMEEEMENQHEWYHEYKSDVEGRLRQIERDYVTDADLRPALTQLFGHLKDKLTEITDKVDEMKQIATASNLRDTPTSFLGVVALNCMDGVGDKLNAVDAHIKQQRVRADGHDCTIRRIGDLHTTLVNRHNDHAGLISDLTQMVSTLQRQVATISAHNEEMLQYISTMNEQRATPPLPSAGASSFGPVRQQPADPARNNGSPFARPPGLRGGSQIFVKTLSGKTLTINDVGSGDTVGVLKEALSEKLHLVFAQNADFYMIFGGRRLADHRTLDSYDIISGSTVWMVLRLRCCMVAGL